ncbi:hypothetical protein [Rhodococcus ruber]|uniref:hypothetical protein n=1 Tax=Rhodococcus ruber TaxID=1830 RepID=UPI003D81842C
MSDDLADLRRRVAALERDLAALYEDPPMPAGEVSPVPRNATFEQAVDLFLDANPWVAANHVLYVTALFKLAQLLDSQTKPSAATVMEFRQNATELRKCRPDSDEGSGEDSFDQAIAKILGDEP